MIGWVGSGLLIAAGLLTIGRGVVLLPNTIQIAQRTQERANNRAASVAEGWGGWFFGGFSSVSLGLQWLGALVGWIGMTMMGIVCIGLGVGLLGSP